MSIYIPQLEDEGDIDLFGGSQGFGNLHDPFLPLSANAPTFPLRSITPRKASLSSQPHHKPSLSSSSAHYEPVAAMAASQRRQDLHAALYDGVVVLMDRFKERSEHKINDILSRPLDQDVFLPSVLAEGVDPAFDKLLDSIGQGSRRMPRLVIDAIMRWRRAQGEGVDEALVHRLAGSPNPAGTRPMAAILNERKLFASIYLLCRVISVVLSVATVDSLSDDLCAQLEDNIYNSLKHADPNQVERSVNRKANMDFYARLIGQLSGHRFISVTDKFTQDLSKLNLGALTKDEEAHTEHMIRAMRFLKFQIYPLEQFEEASEFFGALAELFEVAAGARIKTAMASTMTAVLGPIIATATAEVNHPLWARAIQSAHAKAMSMVSKPRYVAGALPLICAVTASAPEEVLVAQFQACFDICISKSKERITRFSALYGMIQLLWGYLRRCHETHTQLAKRLDPLIKFVFPPGRKVLNPPDVPLALAACIPHFIMHYHFEYGFEIVNTLLGSQPYTTSDTWPLESLSFEKMHVAIRAILLTLDTLENGQDPILPPAPLLDFEGSIHPSVLADLERLQSSVDGLTAAFASRGNIKNLVASSGAAIAKIATTCSKASEFFLVTDDRNVLARGSAPPMNSAEREFTNYKRHGPFWVYYPKDRQPIFDLLRVCIDSWPRLLLPSAFTDRKPIDILLHALLHVDPDVYMAARKALGRLARQPDGHHVLRSLGRFVVRPELVVRDNGSLQGANTVKLESLAGLWAELVAGFLEQVQAAIASRTTTAATHHRMAASTQEVDSQLASLDPRQVWPLLHELEGVGLVLISGQSALLRRRATDVLRQTVKLQQALYDLNNCAAGGPAIKRDERVFPLFTTLAPALLSDFEEEGLTAGERNRLSWWRKQRSEDLVCRLVESDMVIDTVLWHHMLASFFTQCMKITPMPTRLAQNFIIARFVKAHAAATTIANLVPNKMPQPLPNTFNKNAPAMPVQPTDVAFLADHFRTHLIVLCALASGPQVTNQQPPQPGLASGDLTTGSDLVHFAVPYLATDNMPLREAVVRGLGCVSAAAYKSLLESLASIMRLVDTPTRSAPLPQGSFYQTQQSTHYSHVPPRKSMRLTRLQLAVSRVHEIASRLLRKHSRWDSEPKLVAAFVSEATALVRDADGAEDSATIAMRRTVSVCFNNLIEAFPSTHECSIQKLMKDEERHQLFALFESWSFRPTGAASPETSRHGHRSADSHSSFHYTKSRTSSISSQFHGGTYDLFLPATTVVASLCHHNAINMRKERTDRSTAIETKDVLRWAQALFEIPSSAGHACARRAISGLIDHNLDNRHFLDACVQQCYAEPESLTLQQSTFSAVYGAMVKEPKLATKLHKMLALALWKLGHADLPTRQRALDVILAKVPPEVKQKLVTSSEAAIYSTFSGSTLLARQNICNIMATMNAVDPRYIFIELAIRVLQLARNVRQVMHLLPAFLATIKLQPMNRTDPNVPSHDPVLANLFLLSAKHADNYPLESRGMWRALFQSPDAVSTNLPIVLNFLVEEAALRGSKDLTKQAARVIGSISDGDLCSGILTHLADLLQPIGLLYNHDDIKNEASRPSSKRSNMDTVFPVNTRKLLLAPAQSALFLASDALMSQLKTSDPNILRFLHVLIMHVDHSTQFVRNQARDLLVRALTLLRELEKADSPEPLGPSEGLWSWRQFWEHEEQDLIRNAGRVVDNMRRLIEDAVQLIERRIPDVRRLWSAVALEWAHGSPSRHIACRSFQAFRLLDPAVDQKMLAEMLSRLSSTVAEDTQDAQLYTKEVLATLIFVVDNGGDCCLEELPQLWWTVLACAQTNVAEEFRDVLLLGTLLVNKMQAIPKCISAIQLSCPEAMATDSKAILREIVLRGLRSSITLDVTWDFLSTLVTAECAHVLTMPGDIFHLVYSAILLWGLQAMETAHISPEMEALTEAAAALAEQQNKAGVVRTMRSLGKNRFRSKEDFVQQSMSSMREAFSLPEKIDILVLLLGSLQNKAGWVRSRSLSLLKHFARQAQVQDLDLGPLGLDVLDPIHRLLTVPENATAALEVLEEPMPTRRNTRDRSGSESGPGARNGHRPPPLCFGSVAPSGWSVPDPVGDQDLARSRLREVLATCGGPATSSVADSPFAFTMEDPLTAPGAFFDLSAQSEQDHGSTLGDLASTLHDLGSYFEEDSASGIEPDILASSQPSSQGSASRVAAVLARSHKAFAHVRTGSMAAIPETPTSLSEAFSEDCRPEEVEVSDDGHSGWDGFRSHHYGDSMASTTSLELDGLADTTDGDDSSFDLDLLDRRSTRRYGLWKH